MSEFVSLDGVMEDPGGAEGYAHGGWTFKVKRSTDSDRFKMEELEEAEAQLLGRVTYEGFPAAWPAMEEAAGAFGRKMNAMPKYVVSSTLEQAEWRNTTILRGDLGERVNELKQAVDGVILVAGSARLVQGLLERELVDELRLMVFPVILGNGKRLLEATGEPLAPRLVEARELGDGTALLRYEM